MTEPLYHLAVAAHWNDAVARGGPYERSSIDTSLADEGFIHASFASQLRGTADRYYRDRDDIVLLVIHPSLLDVEVRVENLHGGDQLFPHLYGPLPLHAVVEVLPVALNDDGTLQLPPLG